MNPKKDIRFVASGLAIAAAIGMSAYFAAKTSWVSEVQDCGQKLAKHAFKNGVQIKFAGSQQSAFEPMIEKVIASGFEPEFVFRAQCLGFVTAGVREIEPASAIPNYPLSEGDQYRLNVHSVAITNEFCLKNEGALTGESIAKCRNPGIAAAYAFALLTQAERVHSARTALEERTINELLSLKDIRIINTGSSSILAQANPFMDEFTVRLGVSSELKKAAALMDAANAAMVATRSPASKTTSVRR